MAPPSRLSREVNFFESIGYFVADKVNRPLSLLFKEGLQIPYKTPYTRLYASRASVKRGMADDFLQTKIPVANYKGLMVDLDAEEAARSLKKPTIVLIAEYDLVVGNWNSRAVYAALAAKHRDLVLIPKSGHSMQGDHRSQLVLDHTRRWLDRHVKGAKS
jgi:pimeloyl-ACP methyl ester carboxylesterase